MYESYYGLKEKPFNLTPDPAFLYFSQTHKNAYSHLKYAVEENKGFVVITGEIGSGKTTLIKYLLKNADVDVNIGLINNTHLFPKHMLKLICREFELSVNTSDLFELQEVFYGFLLNEFAKRRRVVLIIDEAQFLTPESLEELRLLSNLESDKNHLIQIALIGQPGLKDVIARKGLEQFTQRISVTYHLERLAMDEVAGYINFRMRKAGARNADVFSPEAIEAIRKYTRGIPRLINILCDTALLYGYSDGYKKIGENLIKTIIADRKESGIYDIRKDDSKEKEQVEEPERRPVRMGLESIISTLDDRVEIIEEHLLKIEQDLQNIARDESLKVELLKLLKENIKRRMAMAKTYAMVDSINEKKGRNLIKLFFRKG